MTNNCLPLNNIILLIITTLSIIFANQPLWDLGVIIETDPIIVYQQEIDINNQLLNDTTIPTRSKQIKALHSNNFIPPIIQEIKSPKFNTHNIIKTYDELIHKLSPLDQISSIKKSFLNKEFTNFFSFYKLLNKNHTNDDPTIDLMYIQNLYFSNQPEEAKKAIDDILIHNLTDQLLLYKIKINIKLKNIHSAQNDINYFINKFPNSDWMLYVIYEKKILENKYND